MRKKDQPLTVAVLEEVLNGALGGQDEKFEGLFEKQDQKFEGLLEKQDQKFEGLLEKQEKKFECFVKGESKKYMRQMHFLNRDFQKKQGLMAEAIGELNNKVEKVESNVEDIRKMVGKNCVDIEMMKFDIREIKSELKTKVSREELPESILLKKY